MTGDLLDDLDTGGGVEFDLDRWYDSNRGTPYRFRWGGQVWELPHPRDLPVPLIDLVDSDDLDLGRVRDALVSAFGADQWARLNKTRPFPTSALPELFTRWMAHGGVDVGESSSSADSSPSTVEHSPRTSAVSTG